jgi:uncharacterized protein (TIGR02646 family)
MIRVTRPKVAPAVLRTEGRRLLAQHAQAAAQNTKIEFDRSVYAHATVKKKLVTAQHQKCAFCESKVSHIANGDVEHFRPKAAVRAASGALSQLGYYWLAYEWTNLLFACELCNRRHKANHFPLCDEAKRARSPRDRLNREEPLFIDPAAEDPAEHIGFRKEYAYAIRGEDRGTKTVEALGLNREALVERRRERLSTVRVLVKAIRALSANRRMNKLAQEMTALLLRAESDDAEFAGMVRAARSSW